MDYAKCLPWPQVNTERSFSSVSTANGGGRRLIRRSKAGALKTRRKIKSRYFRSKPYIYLRNSVVVLLVSVCWVEDKNKTKTEDIIKYETSQSYGRYICLFVERIHAPSHGCIIRTGHRTGKMAACRFFSVICSDVIWVFGKSSQRKKAKQNFVFYNCGSAIVKLVSKKLIN